MDKHPFLSDDWFTAVEALLADEAFAAPVDAEMMVNVIVDETPFEREIHVHVGAASGRAVWGHGHAEQADLVLATDYETAKSIFVSGDPMSGMHAFFAGKVRLQGDLTKLAETAASVGGAGGALTFIDPALTERLQAITE
ncbi:MAG: SCP2 sterol-binding domain-containing protein [Acidimicrobiia bacterium]